MNRQGEASIRIEVDVTNPGQFFACCGLIELASRTVSDAVTGSFSGEQSFLIRFGSHDETRSARDIMEMAVNAGLNGALSCEMMARLEQLNAHSRRAKRERQRLSDKDEAQRKYLGSLLRSGPVTIPAPFDLLLDWWRSELDDVPKTWAGSQAVGRIARAALSASTSAFETQSPLDYRIVVRESEENGDDESSESDSNESSESEGASSSGRPKSKVEPFYFDSRRGARPFSRDIGFAPDALRMTTPAFPAVEFLCLVGLQRCRPKPSGKPRVFEYFTWQTPLPVSVLPAAVSGLLPAVGARGYRFENAFRTDQRKHKAFSPAIPLARETST